MAGGMWGSKIKKRNEKGGKNPFRGIHAGKKLGRLGGRCKKKK